MKLWVESPVLCKLGLVVHIYKPSTGEAETGLVTLLGGLLIYH